MPSRIAWEYADLGQELAVALALLNDLAECPSTALVAEIRGWELSLQEDVQVAAAYHDWLVEHGLHRRAALLEPGRSPRALPPRK